MTSEFPAQKASNAEKASMWWRRHYITGDNENNKQFSEFPGLASYNLNLISFV